MKAKDSTRKSIRIIFKLIIKRIGDWEEWVCLLQDRDQRSALVNLATKF